MALFKCLRKKRFNIDKLGIIIPHNKNAQGAYTKDRAINEYTYGLMLASQLNLLWATRNDGGVKAAAKYLSENKVTISIEPHCNAFDGTAKGCEVLVIKDDKESIKYAELLIQAFKEFYPDRRLRANAGIKEIKRGDRGYMNLSMARPYMKACILSELFFIDNPSDYIEPEGIVPVIDRFDQLIMDAQK